MKPCVSDKLVDKALSAMTIAIENFNKPAVSYRGETFALLALNSWELLLKARVIQQKGNKLNAIYVYETKKKKDGSKGKMKVVARNRTKLPQTISPLKAIDILNSLGAHIHPAVSANIEALLEIRDSSAHFLVTSKQLDALITEVSAACVANFVAACKEWFRKDCSENLSILLPLGFFNSAQPVPIISTNPDEKNLINHFHALHVGAETTLHQLTNPSWVDEYAFALKLDFKISHNSTNPSSAQVAKGKPGNQTAIIVDRSLEEQASNFPWTYDDLKKSIIKKRTIKQDGNFREAMRTIKCNGNVALSIFLDPVKKTGPRRIRYTPNATDAFFRSYDSLMPANE